MADQIYRCSDDHLYSASLVRALTHSPLHLGPRTRLLRCPVDHHWRMATRVNPNDLSERQLTEARQHRL
jgi:hypothetical protein